MREMHGTSSRDDRQKREQQRQEKEMAKFAQMYPFPYAFHVLHILVLLCYASLFYFVGIFFSLLITGKEGGLLGGGVTR